MLTGKGFSRSRRGRQAAFQTTISKEAGRSRAWPQFLTVMVGRLTLSVWSRCVQCLPAARWYSEAAECWPVRGLTAIHVSPRSAWVQCSPPISGASRPPELPVAPFPAPPALGTPVVAAWSAVLSL